MSLKTLWLRCLLWVWVLTLCLGLDNQGLAAAETAPGKDAEKVSVLVLTDFHGRLTEGAKDPGLAKLLTAVKTFRTAHPHTLLVAAGDLFTGTVESDLLHGQPTLEGLLRMGLVASAVGNHEFDWSKDDLPRWREAGLPFLSANIRLTGKDKQKVPGIEDGRIFEVGSLRVGVVGLTTTSTARTTKPENVQHLEFLPPAQALKAVVQRLRGQGAEAVIVLAHLAGQERSSWEDGVAPVIREIARVPGVTAVAYGHSHEEHLSREGDTAIVQPAYRGRSLAVLTLQRTAEGQVRADAALDRVWQRKDSLVPDSEGMAIVQKAQQDLGPAMARVVAHAEHDILHKDKGPSLLGQIICQSMLDEVGGQIAVINDGAIRTDLERGPITERQLYQTLPFNNRIMRMSMTGAEVRNMLEAALSENQERGIQVAGITVRYDHTRPEGERVVSMTLANGTVLTAGMDVTVLVNDFLAKGGDGLPFARMGRNKILLEQFQRDILRQWLEKRGNVRETARPWLLRS